LTEEAQGRYLCVDLAILGSGLRVVGLSLKTNPKSFLAVSDFSTPPLKLSNPNMSAEEVTKPTEEDSTAVFEPVVKLEKAVEVKDGEEDEEVLFKM